MKSSKPIILCGPIVISILVVVVGGLAARAAELPPTPRRPGAGQPFAVRGMLPWHNFLCGPSAWNEQDYRLYLDRMKQAGLNLVVFHNYTGGEQRYVSYVEPMIRIRYRDVVGQASFDTSLTARWGYRPLAVREFAFGTDKLFALPPGTEAFGADCAVTARTDEERYAKAQALMRRVLAMAHERGIGFAMGFEFGMHPPEFMSIIPPQARLGASGLLDPTSPAAIELLHSTIDDILRAYPGIDQIWLWLHEHSMFVAGGEGSEEFRQLIKAEGDRFPAESRFNGVWSLAYLREACAYLKQRVPNLTIVISGWGGQEQLTGVLQGLHQALPKDIVFSCLNPAGGAQMHPKVMAEMAKTRTVWAIPWLEQDGAMWHLQPRVALTVESVRKASEDALQGVVAIHWRTEETRPAFEAFALAAQRANRTPSVEQFYAEFCRREYGPLAEKELAGLLATMDREKWLEGPSSPEFYPYDPSLGAMGELTRQRIGRLLAAIERVQQGTSAAEYKAQLQWLADNLRFFQQLEQVGLKMQPAYELRNRYLQRRISGDALRQEAAKASAALGEAPLRELFETYARRVHSRGELGVLSSLNQKLWLQYRELKQFVDDTGR